MITQTANFALSEVQPKLDRTQNTILHYFGHKKEAIPIFTVPTDTNIPIIADSSTMTRPSDILRPDSEIESIRHFSIRQTEDIVVIDNNSAEVTIPVDDANLIVSDLNAVNNPEKERQISFQLQDTPTDAIKDVIADVPLSPLLPSQQSLPLIAKLVCDQDSQAFAPSVSKRGKKTTASSMITKTRISKKKLQMQMNTVELEPKYELGRQASVHAFANPNYVSSDYVNNVSSSKCKPVPVINFNKTDQCQTYIGIFDPFNESGYLNIAMLLSNNAYESK